MNIFLLDSNTAQLVQSGPYAYTALHSNEDFNTLCYLKSLIDSAAMVPCNYSGYYYTCHYRTLQMFIVHIICSFCSGHTYSNEYHWVLGVQWMLYCVSCIIISTLGTTLRCSCVTELHRPQLVTWRRCTDSWL